MTRIGKIITGLALVAMIFSLSPGASAEYPTPERSQWTDITDLDDDAINSAVWTGWLPVHEVAAVVFEIDYTFSAGTDVSMGCESANQDATSGAMPANDAGFEIVKIQDSATTGTSDSYAHVWRDPRDATGKWTWTVGNLPHDFLNCSFVRTGGDANDKVTVRWRGVKP